MFETIIRRKLLNIVHFSGKLFESKGNIVIFPGHLGEHVIIDCYHTGTFDLRHLAFDFS